MAFRVTKGVFFIVLPVLLLVGFAIVFFGGGSFRVLDWDVCVSIWSNLHGHEEIKSAVASANAYKLDVTNAFENLGAYEIEDLLDFFVAIGKFFEGVGLAFRSLFGWLRVVFYYFTLPFEFIASVFDVLLNASDVVGSGGGLDFDSWLHPEESTSAFLMW